MEKENLLKPEFKDSWNVPSVPDPSQNHPGTKPCISTQRVLVILLLISCSANVIQSGYILIQGLPRNPASPMINSPVVVPSEFSSLSNLTETDALWWGMDTSRGFVALSNGQKQLKPSEPFPWDETKSVYLLNAFHSLHCLRVIYISLRQLQRQERLRYNFDHILHCLDSLRSNVLCAADDTPIALGSQPQSRQQQTRQCRDWQQIEDFAIENSACFKGREPGEPGYQTMEEWRHCPAQSPYLTIAQNYSGE